MQGLAADVPEVGIVEKVPGKGMADIFHMDTDLVGASCLETETQERQIRVFIIQKPFIPGGRGLSMVRVRDPLDGRALLPPDGDRDHSAGICFPADSGQILPADLPALHLAGEKGGAEPVFCHQEKAGRVFIQTVDCPEHEGFLFLSEIARQAVGQVLPWFPWEGWTAIPAGLFTTRRCVSSYRMSRSMGTGSTAAELLFSATRTWSWFPSFSTQVEKTAVPSTKKLPGVFLNRTTRREE